MWYLPGRGADEGPRWVKAGTRGAQELDCQLKVGQTDYGFFQPQDPPPFYDLKAEKDDRPMKAREITAERAR